MINRNNYTTIHGWMLLDLKLDGIDLLIYAILYGFSQDGKSKYRGSINYLISFSNSTKLTIIRSLKRLEKRNLINKKKISYNNYEYGIKMIPSWCQNDTTNGIKTIPRTNNKSNNNKKSEIIHQDEISPRFAEARKNIKKVYDKLK